MSNRITKTCKKCGKPMSVRSNTFRDETLLKPWFRFDLCRECWKKDDGEY